MTIFAVICAGIFPGIHVGRVWVAYWLFPIPNQMAMWPNFRSAAPVGRVRGRHLRDGLAALLVHGDDPRSGDDPRPRDNPTPLLHLRCPRLGWRGSTRHWHRYEFAYLLFASLATPLVLSVHSVVSFDFAGLESAGLAHDDLSALLRGRRHLLRLRDGRDLDHPDPKFFGLEEIITARHLENMAKIMLATGTMVGFAYSTEFFMAWYSGNVYEPSPSSIGPSGPTPGPTGRWCPATCSCRRSSGSKLRTQQPRAWWPSIFINVGMWFERFVIVVTLLTATYLPTSWGYYRPASIDDLCRQLRSLSSPSSCSSFVASCRWWAWRRSRASCRRPTSTTPGTAATATTTAILPPRG